MSRVLDYNEKGEPIEKLESKKICKWRICDICCNDDSPLVADFTSPYCKCESKKDCIYFEKEDMVWK